MEQQVITIYIWSLKSDKFGVREVDEYSTKKMDDGSIYYWNSDLQQSVVKLGNSFYTYQKRAR